MHLQVILNKPSPEHKVEDQEFEPNEVYAVDIVVSSGECLGSNGSRAESGTAVHMCDSVTARVAHPHDLSLDSCFPHSLAGIICGHM